MNNKQDEIVGTNSNNSLNFNDISTNAENVSNSLDVTTVIDLSSIQENSSNNHDNNLDYTSVIDLSTAINSNLEHTSVIDLAANNDIKQSANLNQINTEDLFTENTNVNNNVNNDIINNVIIDPISDTNAINTPPAPVVPIINNDINIDGLNSINTPNSINSFSDVTINTINSDSTTVLPENNSDSNITKKKRNKAIPIMLVLCILMISGGFLSYNHFTRPELVLDVAIDKMFETSNNIILELDNFLDSTNTGDSYEITNTFSLNSNISDLEFLNDYESTITTQFKSNKSFSNISLAYKNDELINVDALIDGTTMKLFLNDIYDRIIIVQNLEQDFTDYLKTDNINEYLDVISTENALYLNEFFKNTLKGSIDYDNVTRTVGDAVVNKNEMRVVAYSYDMSLINTVNYFLDAIITDTKTTEIMATLLDMSVVNFKKEVMSMEISEDEEDVIVNFSFYTSGVMNEFVGGIIEADDFTIDYYVLNDITYFECESKNNNITETFTGELSSKEITIIYKDGNNEYHNISILFSSTEIGVDINVYDDTDVNINLNLTKNNTDDYTAVIYIKNDDEFMEFSLNYKINYDFTFKSLPSEFNIYYSKMTEEEMNTILIDVLYTFENTPIGDMLIPLLTYSSYNELDDEYHDI